MARCEVCGNDYYLSFEVVSWKPPYFRLFRVCDTQVGPGVRSLRKQSYRSRDRGKRKLLLLRLLLAAGGRKRCRRSRLPCRPENRRGICEIRRKRKKDSSPVPRAADRKAAQSRATINSRAAGSNRAAADARGAEVSRAAARRAAREIKDVSRTKATVEEIVEKLSRGEQTETFH